MACWERQRAKEQSIQALSLRDLRSDQSLITYPLCELGQMTSPFAVCFLNCKMGENPVQRIIIRVV